MSQAEGTATLTVTSEADMALVVEKSTTEKLAFERKGLTVVYKDHVDMNLIRKWCESQDIKLN